MESLSGLDAAFLAAETDTMPLNVGGILIFERGTLSEVESYDRILRVFASRIHLLPHFRKKVVNAPFGLVQPYWVDDPSFSLSNHVHLVRPSEEVALDQVLEFAGLILAERFDRARPLWDLFVLPRVEEGRFVLIAKLHHAMVDGISGMQALASLFDLSEEFDLTTQPVAHIPESPPSRIEVAAMTLFGLTDHTLMTLSGGVSALKKLPDTFTDSLTGHNLNRAEEMLARSSRTGASGSISSARKVMAHEIDLKTVSVIAKRHGVKVNDVLVAVCHLAVVTYLKSHDLALPDNLVAMIPVSIHDKAGDIDSKNKISALFLRIPTAFDGPGDLLGLVHEITDRAKAVHSDLGSLFFYNLAEVIPPVFLQTVFRLATGSEIFDLVPPVFNYVVSNVPGPDIDLYFGGSRLEKVIPMAPVADGSGITFAFVSYRKVVSLGLVADPKLFPNAGEFGKLIDEFVNGLLKLGE